MEGKDDKGRIIKLENIEILELMYQFFKKAQI